MSSCACIIDYADDFDMSHCEIRTARKPHICFECGCNISIGEVYYYQSAYYDGSFDYSNTCADCWSIVKAFFCAWVWGEVRLDAEEHIVHVIKGEVGSEQILKLTPKARDWVFGLIERAWKIYPEEPDPVKTFERGWVNNNRAGAQGRQK